MTERENLLICTACGTQFDTTDRAALTACRICDDPRQFVPPTGQEFTTLARMRDGPYENKWAQDPEDKRMWSIWTEPKFAIGERAILLQTDRGNVLWDLITYLDTATVEFINSLGGLSAIVISHPHYYTTHLEWARAFNCPVYISEEDKEWICCSSLIGGKVSSKSDKESFEYGRRFIPAETRDFEVLPGVRAVKTGGHFPGSLVLLWEETQRLLIADTFLIVPSGRYHINRPPGTSSFAFMWSIPNMIPLAPDDILGIWKALEGIHFTATHGAFVGMDIRGEGDEIKRRVLESMKIQTRASGHENHALLRQTV